jgi:2-C-methyl-D-erythritol 4-phosphate cytidylyltransferase
MSPPKTVAVVLAGGTGSRVGLGVPKQLLTIAGKTILEHTLDVIQSCDAIDEIMLVANAHHGSEVLDGISTRYSKLRVPFVPGGATRNASTQHAIEALGNQECNVLFHDAVRPFADCRIFRDCVKALEEWEAVDTVIPSADTLVVVDDEGVLSDIPGRDMMRRGQTPQGFRLSTIRRAYELAEQDPFFSSTDDCSVVMRYLPETRIQTVTGSERNIKITDPLDLAIADRIFQLGSVALQSDATPASASAQLRGRSIVVVGGSSGIGLDIVRLAASCGAHPFPISRRTGTDVRDPGSIVDAMQVAIRRHGRIDAVVNAAGVLRRGALTDLTLAAISEQVEINLIGPIMVARAAMPHLAETGGHLLFFTSSSYTRGRAHYSVYSATKAAIVNLTQALADEWAPSGIKVNCMNPERTRTPMRLTNFGAEPEGTLLSPQRVAASAIEVISSDITGQVVDVRVRSIPPHSADTTQGD